MSISSPGEEGLVSGLLLDVYGVPMCLSGMRACVPGAHLIPLLYGCTGWVRYDV